MTEISVEDILRGTTMGRVQSVGQMGVIPILDEDGSASDETISPADVNVSTSGYGVVDIENPSGGVTFVPSGAAWMTELMAQDHAIPTAVILPPGEKAIIEKAMCIQESNSEVPFVLIPLATEGE